MKTSQIPYQNEKGFGGLVLIITLVMMGLLYLFSITAGSSVLQFTDKSQNKIIDKNQLQHQMELILGNQDLCTALLQVTGANFQMGADIQTGATWNLKYRIQSAQVTSLGTQPNGQDLYKFAVRVAPTSSPSTLLFEANAHGSFVNAAGVISACSVAIQPQAACESLGLVWDPTEVRCSICEAMGGSWSASQCAI